eukprot:74081_1
MSQPRHQSKTPRPQNGRALRSSHPKSQRTRAQPLRRPHSYSHPQRTRPHTRNTIPQLPRIKRLKLSEEIELAEGVGMHGMTSHNIASIVNKGQSEQSSSFLSDFIFDENDASTLIDPSPPSHLQYAAKRKITPCRRKRIGAARTKLTPFKTMEDLKTHRFHLAELFQNDAQTKKGLEECFDRIPSYLFEEGYESLPSKKKEKPQVRDSDEEYSTDDGDFKIEQKSRIHNLLLRDCKNHKILRNQQKLSNYLDIVEVNLLKQICIQSDSFFLGLENIQLLQDDVVDILNNIQYLRTNLHRMEQYEVMSWSKIINLGIKHRNYHKLLMILEAIQNLQILHKNLNKLIADNEYSQSVHILSQSKLIINAYKSRIPVMNTFDKRLGKIQSTLSIKLIYKICDICIEKNKRNSIEMNKQLEQYIKSCILLQCPSKSVQIIYNTLQTKFNEMISNICALSTKHKIGNICVSNNIQSYVHGIEDDTEYISILQSIYAWSECVLLSMQSICDSLSSFLNKGSFDSKYHAHINATSIANYESSSTTYCKSLCDEILSLCSVLLQSRDVKNSLMTLYELKSVFAKTLSFLQNVESITKTTCYDIRGVLLNQAQSFLDKFHKERVDKLNKSLESDRWSSVKVPVDVQSEVDQLQSGIKRQSISDTRASLEAIIIHIEDKSVLRRTCMNIKIDIEEEEDDLYDDVDDLRFKSVSSLLCLVALVYEYIECASKLPPIAYDVENKLIDLFTLFNSKTCQLVLGAGAMSTVGMKAITAKHLALAQQSISVLLILLPNIHSKWFIKIIPRNCLPLIQSQINRLNEDLEQHSNEIFNKLISIMEQLIDYKFDGNDQFQSYLVNLNLPKNNVRVHQSISSLMSECRKMYRLMSTYMQSYQISLIFKPIVMQFDMKLNALCAKLQKLHLNNSDQKSNENENGDKVTRRDMTQSFHCLNMAIKFISDKLTRLNCDAQHLTQLCIEID